MECCLFMSFAFVMGKEIKNGEGKPSASRDISHLKEWPGLKEYLRISVYDNGILLCK